LRAARQQLADKAVGLCLSARRTWQVNPRRQHLRRLVAGIDPHQLQKAAAKQRRANQQHHRQGSFANQ
jgi:hypothetical protein